VHKLTRVSSEALYPIEAVNRAYFLEVRPN